MRMVKNRCFGIIIGEKLFWGKGFGTKEWSMMTRYGFIGLVLIIETMIFASNLTH